MRIFKFAKFMKESVVSTIIRYRMETFKCSPHSCTSGLYLYSVCIYSVCIYSVLDYSNYSVCVILV